MSQTLVAPSGTIAGSPVFYPDGTSELVSAALTIDCPNQFVGVLQNAGWMVLVKQVDTTKLARSQNAYIRTDVGTKDLLAAAAADRTVEIIVTVTTAFATGDGAQPTLTIGEESGSASKFAAAAKFASAAAGATFAFSGVLTSGKKLQGTLVAATGTTSTGAYTIDVVAVG